MKADTDRAVADLAAAHDRLAAALYAVDVHPAQALLRGVELRGATARLWSGVDVARLWAGFVAIRAVLDRLRDLTGRSRDADAARIFAAPVPVDPVDGPRGLPSLPPVAFVAELERQCAATVDVLDRIGAARAALTERLIELDTALEAAVAAHHRLGADHTPTTGPLQQRLQQVYAQAVPDPLTVDEAAWSALREELTRTVRQLSELAALRTALPARLTRLDMLLDALAAAEQRAHRAHDAAVAKIADPGLPETTDAHGRWQAAVADLVRATDALDLAGWPALDRRITALDRDLTAAVTAAEDRVAAATGLLDRREELRGRLEAYRAKAVRLDRVEEHDLTERYRAARDLLWAAPCDLRAATRAVFAYQQALSGAAEGSAT
ncbi:hypothetical protein ACFO1B_19700 [Dactylosporangium siamense]|uniref:Uncharacterized protein n=1 Tax=Dactylosporangium siamense TaxID=685454 RepID=A0A919UA57_9ACTN|nr:hypothetical protein [Dactylosporangium siamense]GIG44111.1 hypothetical protein Dsi01nite_021520 [Dactylosporangium siamense]